VVGCEWTSECPNGGACCAVGGSTSCRPAPCPAGGRQLCDYGPDECPNGESCDSTHLCVRTDGGALDAGADVEAE
jgi:hypothetical protein